MSTNARIRGRTLQTIRRRHFADDPLCVMCAEQDIVRLATELDHIQSLYNNGKDESSNRQGLCAECHREKSALDLGHKFRHQIGADGWPIRDTKVERRLSVEAMERRFPSNLTRSRIPLTIVCGPPGSGKSTFLRSRVGPNDVVIDLDQIAQQLSGLPEHHTSSKWVGPSLDERNRQLRNLATDATHERAWFVVAAPDPTERQRWADDLGGQIALLATPLDECIRRINADPSRAGHTDRMIAAATDWWGMNYAG